MNIKRIILFFSIFLLIRVSVKSQTAEDLSDIRVEELTDNQIKRFIVESSKLGLTDDQIEQLALQRGMNQVEVVKLKERIQSMRKSMASSYPTSIQSGSPANPNQKIQDSISNLEQKSIALNGSPFGELRLQNFGFDIFNNPRLTFEPTLRIPTPKNYVLAADDELLISVSGYSEASYQLKISPEGSIRIPSAGPIVLSGMTIEQAKKIITSRLANTIYTHIKTGHTFVEVTLASIRSIKVTVIGEAMLPGTFTLPSLATAYNALYACGGPNKNGTLRNIQIIRNNTTIARIDVYQYLNNGNKKDDIRLMDQDVIKINTYSTRVELNGEIKKPGLYDVMNGEKLSSIIQYAGGFTDNAYTARIQVFRNTSKDRQVSTINQSQYDQLIPSKGDSYIIGRILNRFSNRISIRGAVYRAGEYELRDGMTLTQLINEADGIREDAFVNRGVIHRLKQDLSPELISFDLEKILNGSEKDIPLKKEDRINIFSKFDLKEGYYITIEGEVSSPGVFLYEEGITVQDMIVMAGGLKESASIKRIEISRRIKDADPTQSNVQMALIYQKDISPDMRDSSGTVSFVLEPFDEISIHPAPGYFEQKNVVVEGEVLFAGKYTLKAKNDHISDLINRAGGLTPQAYPDGAVLVRTKNFTKSEQNNYEQGLNNLLKQNFQSGTSVAILQNQVAQSQRNSDNVGIDLKKILDKPGTEYDLLLNDGDTLRIPKLLQTVRVSGEVLYPTLVRYNRSFGFKDYILGAGGYTERALRRRSYAVYANGSVQGTKSFLFIKNYPQLSPGAEIFVPLKKEKQKLSTIEIVSISTALVTMMAILFNSFHK